MVLTTRRVLGNHNSLITSVLFWIYKYCIYKDVVDIINILYQSIALYAVREMNIGMMNNTRLSFLLAKIDVGQYKKIIRDLVH